MEAVAEHWEGVGWVGGGWAASRPRWSALNRGDRSGRVPVIRYIQHGNTLKWCSFQPPPPGMSTMSSQSFGMMNECHRHVTVIRMAMFKNAIMRHHQHHGTPATTSPRQEWLIIGEHVSRMSTRYVNAHTSNEHIIIMIEEYRHVMNR